MLNIKLDGLTGEGMTWTEDGEPHKAPKAVKVVERSLLCNVICRLLNPARTNQKTQQRVVTMTTLLVL